MREAWEAMVKSGRKLGSMLVAIITINQYRVAPSVLNILNSGKKTVRVRDPTCGVYKRAQAVCK